MIQGGDDRCDPPSESEGQERWFTKGYARVVIEGAGHFPAREAPTWVSEALLAHLVSRKKR
jgi:pimeloyl-ACP methyl ester carboxylesterase